MQDYKELQVDEQATGFIGFVYNLYGHWSACDLQENIQAEALWGNIGLG